jgi:hypothetical protein
MIYVKEFQYIVEEKIKQYQIKLNYNNFNIYYITN